MTERIALIDVDGVLMDLIPHTLSKLHEQFHTSDIPTIEQIDKFDVKLCMSNAVYQNMEYLWAQPEFWKNVPLNRDAVALVRTLKNVGFTPVALTAPWKGAQFDFEGIRRDRLVCELGFDRNDVIFCPSKHKHLVAGEILIEDSFENIYAWAQQPSSKQHHASYLVDQPWNRTLLDGRKADEVLHTHNMYLDLYKMWKKSVCRVPDIGSNLIYRIGIDQGRKERP